MAYDMDLVDRLRLAEANEEVRKAKAQIDLIWEVIQLKEENARLRKIEDSLVQAGSDRLASDLSFCVAVATGRIPIGVQTIPAEPAVKQDIANGNK